MRKVGYQNYALDNQRFNERVAPLVETIFQTEHCDPLGYIAPRRYLPYAARKTMPERVHDIVERTQSDAMPTGRYAIADLGDYERIIFAALAMGHGATYVLAGEMGSGKTATMTFMKEVLSRRPVAACHEKCDICDPEVVFVSLDAGTQYTSAHADPVAAFRDDLISSLHNRLRALLIREELTQEFVQFTKTAREQRYQRFGDFQTELSMLQLKTTQAFHMLPEELKCDVLLNWVSKAPSPEMRLDLLGAIAAFVKANARRNNTCFTILVDNIDRHIAPAQQLQILLLLFGLQETGIRVLVAMRQTTFAGLGSIAAFSFQYIPHTGPRPLEVGLKRIRHYLQIFDAWIANTPLTLFERTCLRERLEAIAAMLERDEFPRGRLNALSGASVRSALTLLNRLVINGAMPFHDAAPTHRHDWLRAALLGTDHAQHLASDDRYVSNIFANPTRGTFSWIPVQLLQLVEALFSTRPARNAKTLCAIVTAMIDGEVGSDLLEAVNHLLFPTRPLMVVDGVYEYRSYDEMLARNDVFSLTRAGHLYLKQLVKDSIYLHECLFSLSWVGHEDVPVQVSYKTTVSRSEGARAVTAVLLREDLVQYKRLLDATSRSKYLLPMNLVPISVTMASALGSSAAESMKNAANSIADAYEVRNEAGAWKEVLEHARREMEALDQPIPLCLHRAVNSVNATIAVAEGLLRRS